MELLFMDFLCLNVLKNMRNLYSFFIIVNSTSGKIKFIPFFNCYFFFLLRVSFSVLILLLWIGASWINKSNLI